jgi:hypothetical protein
MAEVFMAEKMVRTQVYLPRTIYEKLQARAEQQELTLALQIRAALEDYLDQAEAEAGKGLLRPDDPIFQMIGMYASDMDDASVNHDHYLYGAPKREERKPLAVREKRSRYQTKTPRRKARR